MSGESRAPSGRGRTSIVRLDARPAWRIAGLLFSGAALVVLALAAELDSVPGLAAQSDRARLASGRGLNLLVVSVDTLRADRLGAYGYDGKTTPNLDAFAAESVRFARTVSQAPWTIPSHMTLFTSLFPSAHGVNRGFRDYQADPGGTGRFRALREGAETLATSLDRAGYRTLALTGGATMSPGFGFERGFEEYVVGDPKLTGNTRKQLLDWFDAPKTRPFFIFLHTFEAHAPYQHADYALPHMTPTEMRLMEERLEANPARQRDVQQLFLEERGLYKPEVTSALYDGGVAAVDAFFGQLIDDLKERGLYDRTLIVFTSDHGEEFADHDPNRFFDCHCTPMYRELLRVPLLVRFPPLAPAGRVVDRLVGLIDVAPTILDLLELPIPETFQGRSLEPHLAGEELGPSWMISEAACEGPEVKAIRTDRYKYIATWPLEPGEDRTRPRGLPVREELYDRFADPRERRDLSRELPQLTERFRHLLERRLDTLASTRLRTGPWDPLESPEVDRLRSLGYL